MPRRSATLLIDAHRVIGRSPVIWANAWQKRRERLACID
jgi:hypothetical protein